MGFDGLVIADNHVSGVGDDPIGVHSSRNVVIRSNTLSSVDGRLLVNNSQNVEIHSNYHERMRAIQDGRSYAGISLLYIGYETPQIHALEPPENISVHDNRLYYPRQSVIRERRSTYTDPFRRR